MLIEQRVEHSNWTRIKWINYDTRALKIENPDRLFTAFYVLLLKGIFFVNVPLIAF
jgi:hypothetical protein